MNIILGYQDNDDQIQIKSWFKFKFKFKFKLMLYEGYLTHDLCAITDPCWIVQYHLSLIITGYLSVYIQIQIQSLYWVNLTKTNAKHTCQQSREEISKNKSKWWFKFDTS